MDEPEDILRIEYILVQNWHSGIKYSSPSGRSSSMGFRTYGHPHIGEWNPFHETSKMVQRIGTVIYGKKLYPWIRQHHPCVGNSTKGVHLQCLVGLSGRQSTSRRPSTWWNTKKEKSGRINFRGNQGFFPREPMFGPLIRWDGKLYLPLANHTLVKIFSKLIKS